MNIFYNRNQVNNKKVYALNANLINLTNDQKIAIENEVNYMEKRNKILNKSVLPLGNFNNKTSNDLLKRRINLFKSIWNYNCKYANKITLSDIDNSKQFKEIMFNETIDKTKNYLDLSYGDLCLSLKKDITKNTFKNSVSNFVKHFKTKKYICKTCYFKFTSKTKLKKHRKKCRFNNATITYYDTKQIKKRSRSMSWSIF